MIKMGSAYEKPVFQWRDKVSSNILADYDRSLQSNQPFPLQIIVVVLRYAGKLPPVEMEILSALDETLVVNISLVELPLLATTSHVKYIRQFYFGFVNN
jgi:hypothetical protein